MSDKVLAKGWEQFTRPEPMWCAPCGAVQPISVAFINRGGGALLFRCEACATQLGAFEPTATKQPEAVRATCKAPEWCGKGYLEEGVPVAKAESPHCAHAVDMVVEGVYAQGRLAYCSQFCADAKQAKANALPPTAQDAVASPTAESGDKPSVAPIPVREWKAPSDLSWRNADAAIRQSIMAHVDGVEAGTSRTSLERDNAAHRPMWSKGVELAHIVKRWK